MPANSTQPGLTAKTMERQPAQSTGEARGTRCDLWPRATAAAITERENGMGDRTTDLLKKLNQHEPICFRTRTCPALAPGDSSSGSAGHCGAEGNQLARLSQDASRPNWICRVLRPAQHGKNAGDNE